MISPKKTEKEGGVTPTAYLLDCMPIHKEPILITRDRLFVPYLPVPVLFTLSGTAIFVDCLDLTCTTAHRLLFNYYGFFLLTTFRTLFFRFTFTHVSRPLFSFGCL